MGKLDNLTLIIEMSLTLLAGHYVQNNFLSNNNPKNLNKNLAFYITNHEGFEPKIYCARNPTEINLERFVEPTIGVGHNLSRPGSREFFNTVLPEVDYDAVRNGLVELSEQQALRLFSSDLDKYIEIARNTFNEFDKFPEYLQIAIVDGCYRGDLLDSPKTRKLISENRFLEAADEYIDRNDYRNAVANNQRGIIKRMNSNREAMIRYANEI